jgi:hypothetical protein
MRRVSLRILESIVKVSPMTNGDALSTAPAGMLSPETINAHKTTPGGIHFASMR